MAIQEFYVQADGVGEFDAVSTDGGVKAEVRHDTSGYYGNIGFKDLNGDTWNGFTILPSNPYEDVIGDELKDIYAIRQAYEYGEEEGLIKHLTRAGYYVAKFVAYGYSQSDFEKGYVLATKEGMAECGGTVESELKGFAQTYEDWRMNEIYEVTVYEGERYLNENDPTDIEIIYKETEMVSGLFGYGSKENLVKDFLGDFDDIVIEDV